MRFFHYFCCVNKISDRFARNIAIAIIVITAVLTAAMAVWRYARPRMPHVDVDYTTYPVRGLDLSAHNGAPDFDSIAAAGYDFVYLKASEGTDYRDPAFPRNYLAARRAGLAVGAYHFFRFDSDGTGQAINYLETIKGCELQLPAVIDIEEWGNPAGIATELINEKIATLLALITSRCGPAMIYTNKNGDARFIRGRYDRTDGSDPELWICSFTDPPLRRRQWRLWQHSHIGQVPGISGEADLNVFNGDRLQWNAWLDSLSHTIKQHH